MDIRGGTEIRGPNTEVRCGWSCWKKMVHKNIVAIEVINSFPFLRMLSPTARYARYTSDLDRSKLDITVLGP